MPGEVGIPPQGDKFGAIAQLGERLHGMQEVSGSIPFSSTNLQVQGSGHTVLESTDLSSVSCIEGLCPPRLVA